MKAFTAIFLALIITLSLTACASSPAETVPTELETQPSASQPAAATEDPRVAEYGAALALLEEGSYDRAKEAFLNLGSYSDSETQAKECDYRKAAALLADEENKAAWELYGQISGYKDADTLRESCRFAYLETVARLEVDGQFHSEIRYSYENGRLALELATYNPDHPKLIPGDFFLRREHTLEDDTITVRSYDEKDNLVEIQIWVFDENNYNTRQSFIYVNYPDDNYTYDLVNDENGRMIQALYYSNGTGEGVPIAKYEYEYDEYGKQTAIKYYTMNKTTWTPEYTICYEYGYDDNGNVQWMSDSGSGCTTEYTYNSQGLLETEVTSGTDYSQTIRYTYDEHGNMIVDHRVTVSNGERTEYINNYTYELIELFAAETEEEE